MHKQKFHFIGIGGIGMSALARILLDKQIAVSGSDLHLSETTEQLKLKGADIRNGHSAKHIASSDTVIFNSQIQKNNPEYQAALSLKCPLLHRSELLAQLMIGHKTLAITGTHGKTTTASLLTTILIEGGFDPTFALGGLISGLNGKLGAGKFFVAEADESDGSFLNYDPNGAIITNMEPEHLDYYHTENALFEAFDVFFSKIKNEDLLFYCGDDPRLCSLPNRKGITYGFEEHNDLRIVNYQQEEWNSQFDLHFKEQVFSQVKVALVGEHNALNVAAAFGLSLSLGVAEEKIRMALCNFPGVARRCEKKADTHGVLFLDDYAHHPTEVRTTLLAVKNAIRERRLVVIFQPHRFTRVRDFYKDFCEAFELADHLFVTDIYSAQEQPIPGIDAHFLLKNIRKFSTVPCEYLPQENRCEVLKSMLKPHDVLLTLGAGDITRLHSHLTKDFFPPKIQLGLIFGGKSCEHEISLRSARFTVASLDSKLYSIRFFGIDKEGKWVIGEEAKTLLDSQKVLNSPHALPFLHPQITAELEKCDLFLPILHGTYGEDGTIQGFFEILDKPYIGPDYRAAAICMDKILTKRLVEANGIKTPRDLTFGHLSWLKNRKQLLEEIQKQFSFPIYVKPVHLGSSVGITRVLSSDQLVDAITLAFRYDTQLLIEEGKEGCRELEFAVMGNTHSFSVSSPGPGEKLAQGEFVDYNKKYGEDTVQTTVYPELPAEILEKGKQLAQLAYEAVGCSGMTRVDFLLDSEGEFWLFEMNPIPGLQKMSLFPKIWGREGLKPDQLFDRLIILALERYQRLKRHYKCLT